MNKKKVLRLILAAGVSAMLFTGCGKESGAQIQTITPMDGPSQTAGASQASESKSQTGASQAGESQSQTAGASQAGESPSQTADGNRYVGEYLDSEVNEPMLTIEAAQGGKYKIEIGIYRLTSIDDGVGELAEDGLKFTATDAAGNPIGGIITVDGNVATVTFTDSTWGYIQNGDTFLYTKAGTVLDVPKSEQTGTAGSNMPIKDNAEEAEYQIKVAMQYLLEELYGDKIFDARIYVDKIYTAEEEQEDPLKSYSLGPDEVAFEVHYEILPVQGTDVNELTAATGVYDEESGWIKEKYNVGILRPNESGEPAYRITDFGTGF